MGTFWMMKTYSEAFRTMIFLDSCCIFFCAASLIIHFRRVSEPINTWLNSLQSGAAVFFTYHFIFFVYLFGLTFFSMALYSGEKIKYTNVPVSFLHWAYNPEQMAAWSRV